jgi:GT2 family glycosyltransferase
VVDCLESVFRLKYKHFKVFVIDNDSQNDSLNHLMDWAGHFPEIPSLSGNLFHNRDLMQITDIELLPSLVFVQNEKNTGFAGGNNIILRILAGQDAFVWLLNPDIVVADNALSELVEFAQIQPYGSIIGSVIKFQNRPEKIHMYGGGRILFNSGTISLVTKSDELAKLDYISGGSLFTHANQFRDIGLLPEDYFLYWEETDWCYDARLRGFQISVCLNSICYDKVGTVIGRGYLAEYYYTRNGLLFLSKYKKEKVRMALFLCFIRLTKKIITGQWNRARGLYRGAESFMKMSSNANK